MKYWCVIFDLDGTLADTIEDIAAAMNRALALNKFPPLPPEAYPRMVGWGMRKLAINALSQYPDTRGVSEDAADKLAADAARFYAEEPLARTKAYDGIADMLFALEQKKLVLAVLSNKPDALARVVVDGLFPARPFALVRGDIAGAARKPDPSAVWDILAALDKTPGETVFAGDSDIDIETALAAGCYPLGVSWGFRSRAVLEKAGAAKIIDTPAELPGLLR